MKIQKWIKSLLSRLINILFLPIRLIFAHETVNKLGLRSLRDERYDIVKKHCKGKLLDIGCGNNELAKSYGNNSIGIDVFDFGGNALIVKDVSQLPFSENSFLTVSFVASLNHITNRREVIKEAYRVLENNGQILITMINPLWGVIRHRLAWWDPDQVHRGMKEDEEMGLYHKYLVSLFKEGSFELVKRKRFILFINNFYIFRKISPASV